MPNEELVAPVGPERIVSLPADPDDLLTELRQILGPLYRQRPAASSEADRQAWLACYTDKYDVKAALPAAIDR